MTCEQCGQELGSTTLCDACIKAREAKRAQMDYYYVAKTKEAGFIGQFTLQDIARRFRAGEMLGDYVATKSVGPSYDQLMKSETADWITVADLVANLSLQIVERNGKEKDGSGNESLFSFRGRIPRATFWSVCLIMMIGRISIGLIIDTIRAGEGGAAVEVIVFFLWQIPSVWVSLATQVKRWHDIGYSGWMVLVGPILIIGIFLIGSLSASHFLSVDLNLLIIIPITVMLIIFMDLSLLMIIPITVMLIIFICLGFIKGTTGPNKYGDDPLQVKAVD